MKDLVLIDFNNFLFTHIHSFNYVMKKENDSVVNNKDDFIGVLIDKMKNLRKKFDKENECDIVICFDDIRSNLWRKDFFKNYKSNRKKNQELNIFFDIYHKYKEKIIDYFNNKDGFNVKKIEKLEADDLIYLYCKKFHKDYEAIFIVSSDKDFVQLHNYFNNIHLYDYKRDRNYQNIDSRAYILEKIIKGDAKDNIKNIGSIRIYDKKFIDFVCEWLQKKRGKYYSEEYMRNKLSEIEKNNFDRFKILVNKYKENKGGKIYRKKNKVKFNSKLIEYLINENLDIDEYIKNNYDNWIYKNYKKNKKLILFTEIPENIVNNNYDKIKVKEEKEENGVNKFFAVESLDNL